MWKRDFLEDDALGREGRGAKAPGPRSFEKVTGEREATYGIQKEEWDIGRERERRGGGTKERFIISALSPMDVPCSCPWSSRGPCPSIRMTSHIHPNQPPHLHLTSIFTALNTPTPPHTFPSSSFPANCITFPSFFILFYSKSYNPSPHAGASEYRINGPGLAPDQSPITFSAPHPVHSQAHYVYSFFFPDATRLSISDSA
jgi:hypothetical protein